MVDEITNQEVLTKYPLTDKKIIIHNSLLYINFFFNFEQKFLNIYYENKKV